MFLCDNWFVVLENKECFLDYIVSRFLGIDCVFFVVVFGFGLYFVEK